MKKTLYFEMDYQEWEALVKKTYNSWLVGKKSQYSWYDDAYEIVADEEWSNDQQHTFTVEKEPLSEYDAERLTKFLEIAPKKAMYMTDILLNDMCNKGIIEPGNYLISVSW